ncbi:pyruvate ferredoxin oxidoreductase beta subunit/2-oxoisovalerate ferredoxin oxidoreductase beta subunit [Geothermobacter ehrlichii]|uniref:Pyruvate ferredoxin oxidoreductase beta subunit/2-oxoisovalerate ferredoxin oxidoreductase beta subunit n=1 Tax=Geothermobacter ehrlichii TaxID=213224 RepID=A0A5D3WGC8_9BACT|nr:thiamine pyrophosphate-dependent enzyme [Geothermobacter ehrlichii]TYO95781.1 pyruvate ferredoxin oxidoreductase beta subunit/2-oxoisovalerate ferredoxin oxidoreductase beta subunit [Geothermobacter ehrlichii]
MTEVAERTIPVQERPAGRPLLRPGNTNCGGCGMSIALQMFGRELAGQPVQLVIPACCGAVAAGSYPFTAFGVPVVLSTFASPAAVATGLARVAALNEEPIRVVCWAGDGGTYDIGMGTLSAAAERNEDVLYICYDNEIYGNTGGQRSSATPLGAATTSTPVGKPEVKKDILAVMAAHRIPYAASVSLAHPEDAGRKFRQALAARGFRFLHILSPCPTGWKSEPAHGIQLIRLAVQSGLYPVLEIRDGRQVTINVEPDFSDLALAEYLAMQGRFRKSGVTAMVLRDAIRQHWEHLRRQA